MVEPNYYAGAINLLAPKSAGLKNWADLKGKKVCAVQGAYYNRRVSQLYGPDLVVFPAVPDALAALQGGNCIAFLFDDTLIVSTLASGNPRWADHEMPLKLEDPQPWAIGVRLDDLQSPFGKLLHEMSVAWHKDGYGQAVRNAERQGFASDVLDARQVQAAVPLAGDDAVGGYHYRFGATPTRIGPCRAMLGRRRITVPAFCSAPPCRGSVMPAVGFRPC